MQGALVEFLGLVLLHEVEGDALLAEEHEVLDQDAGGLLECVLRSNGAVTLKLEVELLVVGLLLHTVVLDVVLHIPDRGEDGIDENRVDGSLIVLVLLGGHIATALLDAQLDVELDALVEVADHVFRVHDLEGGRVLADVACGEGLLTADHHIDHLVVDVLDLALEAHLLEVEDHFGHVLHDTLDGAELMFNPFNADVGDGIALQAGEQDAPERIADGHTEAGLQRTEFKPSVEVIGIEHDDLVGLLEIENRHIGNGVVDYLL